MYDWGKGGLGWGGTKLWFFQKNSNDYGFSEFIGSPFIYNYDEQLKLLKLKEPLNNLGILIQGYSDNPDVQSFFNI